jgi:catechol 2,3-dioxygenase-like lactoylglutathione lyase family enzyme
MAMESKKTTKQVGVTTLKAHLALYVSDVERSIEFYRGMFGLEPAKVRPGYAKFDVAEPPLNLTLNENPAAAGRGAVSHLGIQVASTDDVLALGERWRAAGLATSDEMQTNCCYALQNKTWVRDPDGYEWEAFVVLQDNLAETTLCCAPDAETTTAETTTAAAAPSGVAPPAASLAESASCAAAAPAEAVGAGCCGTSAPTAISR